MHMEHVLGCWVRVQEGKHWDEYFMYDENYSRLAAGCVQPLEQESEIQVKARTHFRS